MEVWPIKQNWDIQIKLVTMQVLSITIGIVHETGYADPSGGTDIALLIKKIVCSCINHIGGVMVRVSS